MSEKEQLYYLLKHVKMGEYDISTFCDLFTTIFDIEIDKTSLNKMEIRVFSELEKYTCRFSPFEEDLKRFPNTYFDEETVRKQIAIASQELGIL